MATSSKMSTLQVSNAISQLTVEETRQLVFQMGVQLKTLDDIAAQYDGENRKQHYVQSWLDVDPEASWDKLITGLREINKNSLATEIESENLSKVPVPSSGPLETAIPAPVGSLPPASLTATPAPVGSLPPASLTATPAPVGSLPPASLTAIPAPVGSLPPPPLTATPAPVGSLPPAPLTATPAPVDSLPPASLTAIPAPVGSLPPAPLTATPASVGSLPPAPLTATPAPVIFEQRVEETRDEIEHFEGEFSDLKYEAQKALSKKQSENPEFFQRFQNHLLDMLVAKKQIHIRFFTRNEDEILNAKTIQKIFTILSRYCNYSNYEIIFHIVKRFCHHELKGRMLRYRGSLTSFEKSTTVDVYLCAISARPGGKLREGFLCMTMKINKPPSECTLYEIRELKESIEEEQSLESYATYIDAPEEGSVRLVLHIHKEVGWMVGVVFSTPDFRHKHLLSDVTIGGQDLMKYLVRCWKLYSHQ